MNIEKTRKLPNVGLLLALQLLGMPNAWATKPAFLAAMVQQLLGGSATPVPPVAAQRTPLARVAQAGEATHEQLAQLEEAERVAAAIATDLDLLGLPDDATGLRRFTKRWVSDRRDALGFSHQSGSIRDISSGRRGIVRIDVPAEHRSQTLAFAHRESPFFRWVRITVPTAHSNPGHQSLEVSITPPLFFQDIPRYAGLEAKLLAANVHTVASLLGLNDDQLRKRVQLTPQELSFVRTKLAVLGYSRPPQDRPVDLPQPEWVSIPALHLGQRARVTFQATPRFLEINQTDGVVRHSGSGMIHPRAPIIVRNPQPYPASNTTRH